MAPSTTTLTLSHTVSINESLKAIIAVADEIDLVAINAVLVAKRAGALSAGFHVVAVELRLFSNRVEQSMSLIGELINGLVRRIAELSKQDRRLRIWLAASARMGGGLDATLAVKQGQLSALADASHSDWQQLRLEIRGALSLCRYGIMLSNNGRIEASYGGTLLPEMSNIVGRIEDIVGQAVSSLKQLNATLNALP